MTDDEIVAAVKAELAQIDGFDELDDFTVRSVVMFTMEVLAGEGLIERAAPLLGVVPDA